MPETIFLKKYAFQLCTRCSDSSAPPRQTFPGRLFLLMFAGHMSLLKFAKRSRASVASSLKANGTVTALITRLPLGGVLVVYSRRVASEITASVRQDPTRSASH